MDTHPAFVRRIAQIYFDTYGVLGHAAAEEYRQRLVPDGTPLFNVVREQVKVITKEHLNRR